MQSDPDPSLRHIEENSPYFQALTDRLPQLVWIARDGGDWVWASPSWVALTGQNPHDYHGHGWQLAVHPDDRKKTDSAWTRADVTGVLDVEHRLLDPAHPSDARWFHTRATQLSEQEGRAREWLGCCTDIHDRKLAQDSVQNRVNQLLVLIHTVVRRTMTKGMSGEAYAERVGTRLSAIARTQAMLNRPDGQIDMAALVSEALLAHAAHESERISIEGPLVLLHRGTAEVLGLAMHELATNAVEHGALSNLVGSIAIRWLIDGEVLRFEWKEAFQTARADDPPRSGFGKQMIETVLKLELGAMASLDILVTGARCTMVIPIGAQVTVPSPANAESAQRES